jgi:ribonuclease Z
MLVACFPFAQSGASRKTKVVILGTGTPLPAPQRLGPSTAVVAQDHAYIFDAGTAVVRRAAAECDRGIKAPL